MMSVEYKTRKILGSHLYLSEREIICVLGDLLIGRVRVTSNQECSHHNMIYLNLV